MPKVHTGNPFPTISEGQHTFIITRSDYKQEFSKITFYFDVDKDGLTHSETYNLDTNGGNIAFYKLLVGLGAYIDDNEDTETDDLNGVKFVANITHTPNPNNPSRPYAHINTDTIQVIDKVAPTPIDLPDDDLPF